MTEEVEKKKRGRKPKALTQEIKEKNIITPATSIINSTEEQETLKKSKRGRKPKFVYSTQDLTQIQQTSLSDDENIIVRLNIVEDLNKLDDNKINDEHPYAYNRDEYCNLSNISDINEQFINNTENIENEIQVNETDLKIVNLLKDFEEKNKVNEWPSNTSICCYWCCHKFDNAPFGIPVNFTNNNFDVFGCFCSLECASAYNFKMHDNIDEMWERYNLINLLYRKLNLGKIVKPAPDKLSLKIFGGYLDIMEFRKYFKSCKLINVNFPPMSSLTQQIEEINDYELNNDYKYIPLDQDRIDKYKAKVMFKRNKPLINKNSLESSMNLKYN
jgi:hypothetical protein